MPRRRHAKRSTRLRMAAHEATAPRAIVARSIARAAAGGRPRAGPKGAVASRTEPGPGGHPPETSSSRRGRRDALLASSLAVTLRGSSARAADAASASSEDRAPAACGSCEGVVDGTLGRCEGFGRDDCRSASTIDRRTSSRLGSTRDPRRTRRGPSRTPSSPPAGACWYRQTKRATMAERANAMGTSWGCLAGTTQSCSNFT